MTLFSTLPQNTFPFHFLGNQTEQQEQTPIQHNANNPTIRDRESKFK
jgi:hypothetical protein